MEEGFLWYSWRGRRSVTRRRKREPASHLEVTEEGVHEQIEHNEGSKEGVDDGHEKQPAS